MDKHPDSPPPAQEQPPQAPTPPDADHERPEDAKLGPELQAHLRAAEREEAWGDGPPLYRSSIAWEPPAPEEAEGRDAGGDGHDGADEAPTQPQDIEDLQDFELPMPRRAEPGAAAGIEPEQLAAMPTRPGDVWVTCIDYGPDQVRMTEVDDLEDFIVHHRPPWATVRWINIDGLTDMTVIRAVAEKYELHPLAVEDLLHLGQRPKVDTYVHAQRSRLFIIARMIQLDEDQVRAEQISVFLGHNTLITFQETRGDVWDPIRARLRKAGSRLRQGDASFLAYSLLDAIVDHCFPILERYAEQLLDLEELVMENPDSTIMGRIHQFNRNLMLLRRQLWPMRDVILHLQRETHECMSDNTRTYLRDVYDHLVQIIDIIETYREIAASMTETYATSMGNRLNEVMKVLTVVTTIFVPLSFLSSVWGMNFARMPEMHWAHAFPWSYPLGFWGLCGCIAGGLVYWFRKRGWL